MSKNIKYIGLDVHAASISISVSEGPGLCRYVSKISNRPDTLKRQLLKLGAADELRVCYEAGPCGYDVYWTLAGVGIECMVVAPSLIPVRSGDRVKTDRRDSEKLARLFRADELTAVWVPSHEHEALRDLVRARESAVRDRTRDRNRLSKFLLRHGIRRPKEMRVWTPRFMDWLNTQVFDIGALNATLRDYRTQVENANDRLVRINQSIEDAISEAPEEIQEVVKALASLRGIAKTTSVTLVAELGKVSRFANAKKLMSYVGMVPTEHSSGGKIRRGAISKTGNAHIRRVLTESAWSYRHKPHKGYQLRKRQEGIEPDILGVSWTAQNRLHKRYNYLKGRNKCSQKVVTAVGRELLGFVWDVAMRVEKKQQQTKERA